MATENIIKGKNSRVNIYNLGTAITGAQTVTPPAANAFQRYIVESKGADSAIPVAENRAFVMNSNSTLTLVAGDSIIPMNSEGCIPVKKVSLNMESELLDVTNQCNFSDETETTLFKTYEDSEIIDLGGSIEMDFSRVSDFQKKIFDQYFYTAQTALDGTVTGTSSSGRTIFVFELLIDNKSNENEFVYLTFSIVFNPPNLEIDLMASTPFTLDYKPSNVLLPTKIVRKVA